MNNIPAYLLVILFCLVSCESKKEPDKDKYEVRKENQNRLDSLNQNEILKLINIHNAIAGWDTVENFTYYLQELFSDKLRPASFMGNIKDIIKYDSMYVLKVVNSNYQSPNAFIAEISVNTLMFNKLKSLLKSSKGNEGCFIFQVENITSNIPVLKSEIDESSSYLTLDFDETLIKFKGQLIDFYLNAKLNEDE